MRIRLILNSGFAGPHAWFFLARERGYFRDAGLDVELLPGSGAAAIVPLIGQQAIDAGFGDLNALAALAAYGAPHSAAIAVFAMFNAPPFTIAVPADSGIRVAADLAGRTLQGHAEDAALKLFPALADAAGIDAATVGIVHATAGLGELVGGMLRNRNVDGVFGFVNTILAAIAPLDIDPARLRFINFADYVPDLYSNSLMLSRDFLTRAPDHARGLVHALNRGLHDTLADLDAGIAAVARAAPAIDRAVQRRRLLGTLHMEMAHAEGAHIGIGDLDDARLARGVALLARSGRWPRIPQPAELFTRALLPALALRVRHLAKPQPLADPTPPIASR